MVDRESSDHTGARRYPRDRQSQRSAVRTVRKITELTITFGRQPPFDWFVLLQSAGIVLSILLSAYLMIRDKRSRRLANYLQLVQYHRDIWRMTLELDGLGRVTNRDPELASEQPTAREAQFLTFIFLHMTCSFQLANQKEIITIEQLKFDFTEFLKAPLVAAFWSARKQYYNADFAAFVDGCVEKPKQELDPVAQETVSHSVAAAPTPKRPRKQRKAG